MELCGRRHGFITWLCLAVLLAPTLARAEKVESKLPSEIVAAAEYRAGKAGYPAVLFLHGFMQTRNSPPLNRLADSLADAGFTILAPTLSLGVSRRSKSLPCEAVHNHTLQGDVKEIDHWVRWLGVHSHRKIVLVGHSSGGKDVLAYISDKPDSAVVKAILVSIAPSQLDADEYQSVRAEKMPDPTVKPPLRRFTIAYCKKNYTTTAPAYLSYADWADDRIIDALGRVKVPTELVLGSKDEIFHKGWLERLQKTRVPMTMIEGAGHFFDGEHEFDLLDQVNDILARLRG